jgi:hypothetical protein
MLRLLNSPLSDLGACRVFKFTSDRSGKSCGYFLRHWKISEPVMGLTYIQPWEICGDVVRFISTPGRSGEMQRGYLPGDLGSCCEFFLFTVNDVGETCGLLFTTANFF